MNKPIQPLTKDLDGTMSFLANKDAADLLKSHPLIEMNGVVDENYSATDHQPFEMENNPMKKIALSDSTSPATEVPVADIAQIPTPTVEVAYYAADPAELICKIQSGAAPSPVRNLPKLFPKLAAFKRLILRGIPALLEIELLDVLSLIERSSLNVASLTMVWSSTYPASQTFVWVTISGELIQDDATDKDQAALVLAIKHLREKLVAPSKAIEDFSSKRLRLSSNTSFATTSREGLAWIASRGIRVDCRGINRRKIPYLLEFLEKVSEPLRGTPLTRINVAWDDALNQEQEVVEFTSPTQRGQGFIDSHVDQYKKVALDKEIEKFKFKLCMLGSSGADPEERITVRGVEAEGYLALNSLKETCYKEQKKRIESIVDARNKRNDVLSADVFYPKGVDLSMSEFPSFEGVTQFIKVYLEAAWVSNKPIYLPPILLNGPPGIGKTEYLSRLCKKIGVPFYKIDMSALSTGSRIAGSEIYWANATHGIVAKAILIDGAFNPLIFLDELDKSGHNDQRSHPHSGLYSLLEKTTATSFEDVSLPGVFMNASGVNWMASTNTVHVLSEPIRSRFKVFDIPPPDTKQMRVVINSIYQSILEAENWSLEDALREDTMDALVKENPRDAKRMLSFACVNAVASKRQFCTPEDFKNMIGRSMRAIGFVNS